jgi:hypothetical protein
MSLFYHILGLMAVFDACLKSIRVNYIIRGDWILFAIIFLYSFAAASALGLPWPRLPLEIPLDYPALQLSLSLSALALLVICWVRRDIVFRPMNIIARGVEVSQTSALVRPEQIDLRIWSRFNRGPGHSVWLRDFPVRFNIDDSGTISLETYVEDGGTFLGSASLLGSSGAWSLVVPRQAFTHDREEGKVYFGLSARPAFRLTLPERPMTTILSVKNAAQLTALSRLFDVLLAESSLREANFFQTKLEANLSPPSHTHAPSGPTKRQDTPAEEIPWKDLIDFSR